MPSFRCVLHTHHPRQVAKKGVKDGEWIMLGFIVFGLAVLKKILGPAKLALELVVTSFFSYLFLSLAQGGDM